MKKNSILLSSAFYSIGNMMGAGLNMVYQFMLMMFIPIDDYGIIQPLLQFVGLLILPVSAYQYALTKHFSGMDSQELREESFCVVRKVNIVILCVSILWLLLIPVFKNIFHVDNTPIFVLLLISLVLNIVQVPYVCRLQAEKKFFMAGTAQIIQGVVRMSLGLACVWKFSHIFGAMTGVLLSNIAFVLSNSFEYRKDIFTRGSKNYTSKKISLRLLLVSLGSVGLFSLLVYSDTVLVRILLPQDSALFASANLLGKGMIFLTSGISFVVLPLMAEKLGNSKKSLWIGFSCLLILVFSYSGFFYVTAPYLEKFLFSNESSIEGIFQKFMPYYNLMFMPYPLIYYFLNYYLVKENPFYPCVLFVGILTLYTGIFYFHEDIYTITNVIGSVGYALLGVVIVHSLVSKDKGAIHEEQIDESSIENLV